MVTTRTRNRLPVWVKRFAAVLLSLLIVLLVAEGVVRAIGEEDDDGNFYFRGRAVGVIHPQVNWVRRKNAEYRSSKSTRMIYDPRTGWSPRPDSSSHAGMYRYNSKGIRSAPAEYRRIPEKGILRIALFGDSFTHGDDVPYEETWGHLLEKKLTATGVRAEVINFGVSAYGMDQAFLRWKQIGRKFKPHVVLFGFQAENVGRNVNLLRGFYAVHTGIPFSKPRFVLDRNGALKAINLPAMPIESVPNVMADMPNWQWAKHEWFYHAEDYRRRFWHGSRLLSLCVDQVTKRIPEVTRPRSVFAADGEPVRVTLRLLQDFRDDVTANGGQFVIVHLPKNSDLQRSIREKRSHRGTRLTYETLLRQIEKEHAFVDPFNVLLEAAGENGERLNSLFVTKKRHYSVQGNRIIAGSIAASRR